MYGRSLGPRSRSGLEMLTSLWSTISTRSGTMYRVHTERLFLSKLLEPPNFIQMQGGTPVGTPIDADGNPVDVTQKWSLQSEDMQRRTNSQITVYKSFIEEQEGCSFTTIDLDSGRVLVVLDKGDPLVAYLSDTSKDARLVLDNFTPEIWSEWHPGAEDQRNPTG